MLSAPVNPRIDGVKSLKILVQKSLFVHAKVVRAEWVKCKIFAKRPAKDMILLESRETFDSIPDMICAHKSW
ncbi:MAG: hypothetical protein CO094_01655 [Anaerolineae bacterium CG_4_9_14_3_um_filter_57_17]|nr:MAG: hypothetical protein AUK01_11175 [Anaerolineae bacterium CG2_30_57_67]PJB68283.1 MAG: hypothetical protein CO094_01655 [Anaerolineae bacterium CG_4_9_14_3_um_filter_57_17]